MTGRAGKRDCTRSKRAQNEWAVNGIKRGGRQLASKKKRVKGENDASREAEDVSVSEKDGEEDASLWAPASGGMEEAFQMAQHMEDNGEFKDAAQSYATLSELGEELLSNGNDGDDSSRLSLFACTRVPVLVVCSSAANSLGGIYFEEDDVVSARQWFSKALKLWPGNVMAVLNLANVEHDHGSAREALKGFENVLSICNSDGYQQGDEEDWLEAWVSGPRKHCCAVASAMAATLYHQLGRGTEAVPLLQRLGCRYRLSPRLFEYYKTTQTKSGQSGLTSVKLACSDTQAVQLIPDAITPELHAALLNAFRPDSDYWTETDYKDRGYYSFWYRLDREPTNLVELMVRGAVERAFGKKTRNKLVGAEWWVHSRRGSCSAHQCHFDTEENHLAEGEIVHPLVSSVTYLSGAGFGGSTAVLDQTVEQEEPAVKAVVAEPIDRTMLLFPGNALHCVLPPNVETQADQHRLTLMIGFWTKDVHSKGKRTRLGPCSVIPRATRANTWPAALDIPPALRQGKNTAGKQPEQLDQQRSGLIEISPAWEEVPPPSTEQDMITFPSDCDMRFFVPSMSVFREQLLDTVCN